MILDNPYASGSLAVENNLTASNGIITGDLTVGGTINATVQGISATASYVEFGNIDNLPALISQSASTVLTASVLSTGDFLPDTTNTYDLGSPDKQWRDLYLSSASLYVDGVKILSSDTNTLTFTTDEGQSIKILETGADDITLQTDTGNIELKGTVEITSGKKIIDSAGTIIQFGDSLGVTGSIEVSGTVDGIDLQSFSSSIQLRAANNEATGSDHEDRLLRYETSSVLSGSAQIATDISGSFTSISESLAGRITNNEATGSDHEARLLTYETSSILSGSAQIASDISGSSTALSESLAGRIAGQESFSSSLNTTNLILSGAFSGSFVGDGSQLSGVTSYTDTDTLTYINSIGVISGSGQIATDISGSFGDVSGSLSSRVTNLESTASNHEGRLLRYETSSILSGSLQIADDISGSLGTNATLIRSLTAEGISGSFTADSSSLAVRSADLEVTASNHENRLLRYETSSIISGSLQIADDISGSLGVNATLIRSLNATDISGSLGANATLIRSLTASGITGSFTSLSGSIATDINTKLNVADTGSFAKTNIDNSFGGTQTFESINVNATASFGYVQAVTGSATYIGDEFVIVNAAVDGARFAGIQVYDSESNLQHTASLAWDSLNNKWIYANASGSTYSGGGLISGPRNTGSLGEETFPTFNYVVRSQGGDHIYNSNIIDNDTAIKLGINTEVTGSLIVSSGITGALTGNASTATSASYSTYATSAGSATTATSASYATFAASAGSATTATSASYASAAPYSGLHGTVPTWNQNTTGNAATATSASYSTYAASAGTAGSATTATSASYASAAPYSGLHGTIPTWNQNTTGNAATATSASYATYAASAGTAASATNATSASYAATGPFLSSESDTLATVTGRGATTPDTVTIEGGLNVGSSNNTGALLDIIAINTAGSPAATARIRMRGYEGRAIGTFYEDVTYSGEEWFSGMRYNGDFNNFVIGYDEAGGQAEYAANAMFTVGSDGSATITGTLAVGGASGTINGSTIWHAGNLTNLNQLTNGPGYITGYTETDTLATVTGRGATTSTAITISAVDSGLKLQHNGTSAAWRGRMGSFNSTADTSAFLGTYAGRPGVFGHNNGLSAWSDLYVNTLGVYGQGTLYLSWNTYVKGDGSDTNYSIWHSGNDGAGSGLDADTVDGIQAASFLRSDADDTTSGTLTIGGGLVIEGSAASGGTDYGYYENAGTNIILKGDASGRSGIFFQSEKNGTNINHPSDYGFLQFHSYGYGGSTGEANALVLGVANDSTDIVVLQAPYNNGVKIGYKDTTSGTGLSLGTVWHSANDGAGSGLDADTVDGIQAASFVRSDADDTKSGILTMEAGSGTNYIRMGRFPASTTNTGEAWIGRASDRSTGTMTVQLGNATGTVFEVVDYAWSTVVFNAGMNSFSYKGYTIWHSGNDGAGSGLDADNLDGVTWGNVNTDIIPSTNGTRNLGSSSYRWNTVYTSDLSMSNGIGDYTIVEGEEDLFLYNNKNGKVYKFLIQEVDPSAAPAKRE